MSTYSIGPASQIPRGEGRNFLVGEQMVAVFRTRDGGIFATQAVCPHRGGPLADGLTDAATVICPLHDHVYALATGVGIGNACRIATFPTEVSGDGTVLISLV